MSGTEKITDKIISQAREQAKGITDAAKEEAAKAVKKAEQTALQKAEHLVADARREMVEREKRIVAVAEIEVKKRELAAKRVVIDEAYSAALTKLASMEQGEYRKLYLKVVLPALTKGTETIAPAAKDEERLGQGFLALVNKQLEDMGKKAEVKLAPPRQETDFGLYVTDGGMEIDLSNKAVIKAVREKTEGETAKLLFMGDK